MSLTPEDLEAIGSLMDEKFKFELAPLKEDIKTIKRHVEAIDSGLSRLELKVEVMSEKLDAIHSTVVEHDELLGNNR